jgi:iron complex transport system ATP-binding protein
MIELNEITVWYPGAAEATLHEVSLTAERGQITALVGPNGSGKSTLVRALLRRVSMSQGSVRVDGLDLHTLTHREFAQRVAVVTQREESTFTRTVRDYLALGEYPRMGVWSGTSDSDTLILSAATRAGVETFLGRRTDELSGGEWQRVRIARALMQQADTFVLDEPTTFLDIAHEMATFELLDRLAREGKAVLLVSHQLNLVARFAHRMVLLHRGRIVADGAPDTVMRGDVLEMVYEWPVVVTRDPAVNAPALVPLRRI